MKKVNLFIVGLPKTGSSALYYFLREHPQIFMCPLKEPRYFATDFHRSNDQFSNNKGIFKIRTEDQYHDLFKDRTNEVVVGDTSIQYLYSKEAAENIKNYNPDAKIIIMLREPVSFLYSFHQMSVRTFREDKDFVTALLLEDERKKGNHIPKNAAFPESHYYTDRIKYTEQVKRFTDQFPKEQIKIIIHDDFKESNHKIFKEILSFLGVDPLFTPVFKKHNVAQVIRTPNIARFFNNQIIWKAGKICTPKILKVPIKRIMRKIIYKKNNNNYIDPVFRSFLMKKYKPEVEKISNFLGKDLVTLWEYKGINEKNV